MKPAVLRPCARSRSRCSIGNRTSACVPDRKIRFASRRYLSSSPTSINAIIPSPSRYSRAGCLNRSHWVQNAPILLCVPSLNPWPQDISRRGPDSLALLPKPVFFETLAPQGKETAGRSCQTRKTNNMARLPYLEADQVAPEYRDMLKRHTHLHKLLVNSPDMARAFNGVGNFIRFKSKLDPRLRELAILQVGWLEKSEYEFTHHVKIGKEFGVTDDDIKAMMAETEGKPSNLE